MNLEVLSFDPPSTPTGPTLLCLGGLGQTAAEFVEISGLRDVAAQLGRRVVFAMPRDEVWNYYVPSPSMDALHSLVQSLVTPADYEVDILGFSAGAVAIYSYLCEYGETNHIRRVVSYAGERKWLGPVGDFPGVDALLIRNLQDELVREEYQRDLYAAYAIRGAVTDTLTVNPPQPWPTYPGARLGHFWWQGVNPQVKDFLGAS